MSTTNPTQPTNPPHPVYRIKDRAPELPPEGSELRLYIYEDIVCFWWKFERLNLPLPSRFSHWTWSERRPTVAPDTRVCHAPGDKCLGCPHYHGKADVCEYAPSATDTLPAPPAAQGESCTRTDAGQTGNQPVGQHTPTPWRLATNPGGPEKQPAFPHIEDCSGLPHGQDIVAMPLGDMETVRANAAFIVKAVNEYESDKATIAELVAALESCKDALSEYVHGDVENPAALKRAYNEALAALARAKGGAK